ncbi:MAG: dioxygenase [Burkholderiales bacterium]|nr:dioxygenase [Burkholderiales bacterium]
MSGAALPAVFVSHGSPMHAIEPGAAREAWRSLAREIGRPRAILVASAHWETPAPALTASARPETIHDFYGFPRALYEIAYPAPGAPEVAERAAALLRAAGFSAALDRSRGLDHGAWAPLLHMYPEADVPVLELSVQSALGPRHHLALGAALAALAHEGVLIVGSGHLTHNLAERTDGPPLAYVREFQSWVRQRIESRELAALAAYRARTPHGVRAHPTEEHFLPLFVALGAAGPAYRATRLYAGIETGSLAMDAYRFDAA